MTLPNPIAVADDPQRKVSPKVLFGVLADHFRREGNTSATPEERVIEFMRAFSPHVLHLPTMDVIERLARDMKIAKRLRRNSSPVEQQAAEKFFGVPRNTLRSVMRKNGIQSSDAEVRSLQKANGMLIATLKVNPALNACRRERSL